MKQLSGYLVLILLTACGANEGILKSGKETPAPGNAQPARSSFERDLEEFRTADFSFIYVLRRKDAGPIDSEDRGVIKLQTVDANRRVSSDDGKAIIIGSNNQLLPQNMAALYARFAVDNYSPAPPPAANSNANATTNK